MRKVLQLTKKLSRDFTAVVADEPEDGDLLCNLFGWRPKWVQRFNNMKIFMLCFVCLGIFRGISFSYFSAMLPSIEKRFGFSSQSIGTVKAMNDVSHLLSALVIAHFGGAGHRPRWIAGGSLLVGLGFLLMAAPEVFFPASQISSLANVMFSGADKNEPLCSASRNSSVYAAKNCSKASNDHIGPLIVLGCAEFIIGLGSTAAMILGMPFVDDNVKNKNSPLYFAISFAGYIFGPVLGMGLSAAFNTIYFDFSHPDFKPSDPRWISAWYLGFIISGVGTILMGLIISCFPSAIAKSKYQRKHSKTIPPAMTNGNYLSQSDEKPAVEPATAVVVPDKQGPPKPKPVTLKDLPINLKRLFTNSVYMTKLVEQLLSAFALSGYMSFMQKFLKEQYHLPQSTTNLAGGLPPIAAGFLGIGIGSIVIRHFKLRPRDVCLLMASSSIISSACYFSVIRMGCDRQNIIGVDDVADPYNITSEDLCVNEHNCNCIDFQFSPVCDLVTHQTYVSSCVAGCRGAKRKEDTRTMYYYDCACTGGNTSAFLNPENSDSSSHSRETTTWLPYADRTKKSPVRAGVCPQSCPNFIYYVVVMCIAKFFMGIPAAGVFMIQFRIVDIDLKSLASGLTTVVMSVFGMLPAPIIVGKLIDSACRLWQKDSCGQKGACWIYNADEFRWKLHALVGAVRFINCIIELIIAYKLRNLTFDRAADNKGDITTSSQLNLVADDRADDDELPAEMQQSAVIAEARRKSIFVQDGVIA